MAALLSVIVKHFIRFLRKLNLVLPEQDSLGAGANDRRMPALLIGSASCGRIKLNWSFKNFKSSKILNLFHFVHIHAPYIFIIRNLYSLYNSFIIKSLSTE